MITTLLVFAAALFVLACLVNLGVPFRGRRSISARHKVLIAAWGSMFIGQLQLFRHDASLGGADAIQTGHLYQLLWMFLAGILVLKLVLSAKIAAKVWKLPLLAFLGFCFFAIASSAFSPLKALSLYKAMQILMDAALVIVACSELIRARKPELIVNVTVAMLSILLFVVVLGGILVPDLALAANQGALGASLRGVVPDIHPNELGLMAAIGLVVGVIRSANISSSLRVRFFWVALALLSGVVLFLAQARTSLAGALLALVLAGLLIKKLRWLAAGAFGSVLALFVYYQFIGSSLGVEDTVGHYVTRGTSTEQLQSLSGRTGLWEIGWRMFEDAPFFGHGYGAGVRVAGMAYGLPDGMNMHSSHMQVLVDMGAVGYAAWLVFVISTFAVVFKVMRKSIHFPADRYLAVEGMLVVFVIIFRSFLGHVLVSHQQNLMIFFAVYIYAMVKLVSYGMGESSDARPQISRKSNGVLPRRGSNLLARKD